MRNSVHFLEPILLLLGVARESCLMAAPSKAADRVYRIGYGGDVPYHFRDASGQPAGLAVEMVKEAARRRGIQLDWRISGTPGMPALQNGDVDLWVLMTVRPERRALVHLTDPFLVTETCFLFPDSSRLQQVGDLAKSRVAILDFDTYRRDLDSLLPDALIVPVGTAFEAIQAIEQGRAGATFLDQLTASSALLSGASKSPMRLLSSGLPRSFMGLASTFATQTVVDEIREEMRNLANEGTVGRLAQRWGLFASLSTDLIEKLERDSRQNRILWIVVGVLAVGLALIGLLTRRLSQQRDIAASHELSLRLSEERWQLALRGSRDGIWDYNIETGEVFYSDQWKQMLGYSPHELKNERETWHRLLHPEDATRAARLVKDHLEAKTESYSAEYRMLAKDGEYRWILARGKATRGPTAKALRLTGAHTDITERKKVEESLRVSQAQAEAANIAKSQFVANMSHEIRTPMNAILGMASLIETASSDQERRHYAQLLTEAAKSLLGLLTQILDLSRIEADHMELEQLPFSIPDCMAWVHQLFVVSARQKQLSLVIEIEPEVPKAVVGDPLRLRQVLANLIGNALKFTEFGSVTLRAALDRTVAGDRIAIRFEVVDTGIGIPLEKQAGLFEAFHQADETTTRRYGGSGLGLAIAKKLVEAMGGEIGMQSEPTRGTCLWFTARFRSAGDTAAPEQPLVLQGQFLKVARPQNQAPGRRLNILVAEDNKMNQTLMCKLLERDGHAVRLAENGAEAVDLCRTESFDLILMDLHMPVMGGIEAAKSIRQQDAKYASTPIWAFTAAAFESDRSSCFEAGMDGFLTKPVDLVQLREVLHRISR